MKKNRVIKLLCLVLALVMLAIPMAACEQGAQGPQGEQGAQGPKGDQGPQGLQGETGATGAAGKSAFELAQENGYTGTLDEWLDSLRGEVGGNGKSAYELAQEKGYTGTLEQWLESLIGATGPKGDKGEQGETGATGPQGPQGEKGEQGETGATGPQGPQGEKGEQGETGATGPQGPQGEKGEQGETGATGPQGPQGEKGEQGETGATGPQGPQGEKGEQGETGATGAPGKSAYELAVDAGFEGTLEEWLDSLAEQWAESRKNKQIQELLTLKKPLRVNEDGSFKVLVLADVQCVTVAGLTTSGTMANIQKAIETEQPDLVLFSGDNAWHISDPNVFREYIRTMVAPVEAAGIPWAHVYGNHDDEANPWNPIALPKAEQQKIYEEFEYCVSKAGDESLFGVGNYVLPVLSHDGSKIAFNVWALDSGAYAHDIDGDAMIEASFKDKNGDTQKNYFYGKYEGLKENQVEWYLKTSALLEEYNGEKIPSMMYFHIPLQETYLAWKLAAMGKHNTEMIGTKGENISAPATNPGLFSAILKRGDVQLIANGHDHANDFSVEYRGVNLAYCGSIGKGEGGSYSDPNIEGGRVIEFSANDPWNLDTYMSYVNKSAASDPNAPYLELVIGADKNSVSNGVLDRPEVTYHEQGTAVTVTRDDVLGQNVLNFGGSANKPSVYNIAAYGTSGLFSDGFTCEVLFKITDTSDINSYAGILNFEEGGGFGIDVLKDGDSTTTFLLETELATTGGAKVEKHKLNIGEWYHCVYVYTGSSTAVYINGVKVAGTDNITGTYKDVNFNGRPTDAYICVGGCAQAYWDTDSDGSNEKVQGFRGMTGSIATANVFVTVLTEAEIQALWQDCPLYDAE